VAMNKLGLFDRPLQGWGCPISLAQLEECWRGWMPSRMSYPPPGCISWPIRADETDHAAWLSLTLPRLFEAARALIEATGDGFGFGEGAW